ncbi:MAG: hypothetical protein AAF797_12200 [Planctomycetota bacterium]
MRGLNRCVVLCGAVLIGAVGQAGVGLADAVDDGGFGAREALRAEAVAWMREASELVWHIKPGRDAGGEDLDEYEWLYRWGYIAQLQGWLGDTKGVQDTHARLEGLKLLWGEDEHSWVIASQVFGWAGLGEWERAEQLVARIGVAEDRWDAEIVLASSRGMHGDVVGMRQAMDAVCRELKAAAENGGMVDGEELFGDLKDYWASAVHEQVHGGDLRGAWQRAQGIGDEETRLWVELSVLAHMVESGDAGMRAAVPGVIERAQAWTDALAADEAAGRVEDFDPEYPESLSWRMELVGAYAAVGDGVAMRREIAAFGDHAMRVDALLFGVFHLSDDVPGAAALRRGLWDEAKQRCMGLEVAWERGWGMSMLAEAALWKLDDDGATARALLAEQQTPLMRVAALSGLAAGVAMVLEDAGELMGGHEVAGVGDPAEAEGRASEVEVMAEVGVDWKMQGRAWAREAFAAIASHRQGLEAGTVEYSRATSLLEDLAVTQAQLGDREGVSVSLASVDQALTSSHPKRSAFLRANGLAPGWRASALASAYLGDYGDAATIIRLAESLDWPTGNFGVLVGLEQVIPLAKGFRGDIAGMRAGLEPLYVAIQNERDRLPPVVDDADALFAPADGNPDEPRGLILSAEPLQTLLREQIEAGDALGALKRWQTMRPGMDRETVRDDLIQGLAEVGAKQELVELVEGMRVEAQPVGLTGLDQEIYPVIRDWNTARGFASLGHWDEAERGMRAYFGLPIWNALESGGSMRVGGLTAMALVLVGPEFRAERLELLEEAMGELSKRSSEGNRDWYCADIARVTARLGERALSERLLAEAETSEGKARVLVALAAGAAERVWFERRKARVD